MRSRILHSATMHHRFTPKRHHFRYGLYLLALDLDELAEVDGGLKLLGINRRRLLSIREADFLPVRETPTHRDTAPAPANLGTPTDRSLKSRVFAWLTAQGVPAEPNARVELITLPRVLGYQFNPVSFYFIYRADGSPLAAIAEVTNTFHEMKPFLLRPETFDGQSFRLRVPKHFYVSPFSDVDLAFDFTLHPVGDRMRIQIDDYAGETRTLTSTLTGQAGPLTDRALAGCFFRYPLQSLRVISLIHWHALRLWLKKVPWFAKAAKARNQRDLYRPHASLQTDKTGPQ